MKRLCWWILLWVLLPNSARANPLDEFGFGARAIAMASAITAVTNDSTANYYNPAGLTLARGLTIDVGYFYNKPQLRINGGDLGVDNASGIQAGIVIPGDIGPVRWAFGVALFLPDKRVSRVRSLPQFQPRFVLYDNRPQRLFLSTNLALRPIKWLTIGAGVTFLTNTRGGLDITGRVTIPDPSMSQLLTEVDVKFQTVRYLTAGVIVNPIKSLSISLVYRGEVKVELDIGAAVNGFITDAKFSLALPGRFKLSSLNRNLFSPQTVILGLGWYPIPRLLWTVDVAWLDWSRYPPSTAEVQVDIDVLGIDPNSAAPKVTVIAPRFKDRITFRTGLEYRLTAHHMVDLFFRGGYAYLPTPAPNQTGETNYVDNERHLFSFGLGIEIKNYSSAMTKPISLDFAFSYLHFKSRLHLKSDPADIIGDYQSSGRILSVAVSGRLQF